MLVWRSASGGAAELFSRSSHDWGRNAPPHATAAAVLVSLVRDALVYDEDDTLRITTGARARWWERGELHGAPSRWGVFDLRFALDGDEASWTWTPVPVWTSLTLPPGRVLAERPRTPLVGEPGSVRVLAPPGTRSARVKVRNAAR
jgi:hypothetical protein